MSKKHQCNYEELEKILPPGSAICFVNQFRESRLAALKDAEAFDGIVHVIERLGSFLSKGIGIGLGQYEATLSKLANCSPLARDLPDGFPSLFANFGARYKQMQNARNDVVHQGAFARHLTTCAIEVAIILEDALHKFTGGLVRDFMVRGPVCAELWQPIAFIRQQMLANSFSHLPFRNGDKWYVVSDAAVAIFLMGAGRKGRLAMPLSEAVNQKDAGMAAPVEWIDCEASREAALNLMKERGSPILLVYNEKLRDRDELDGIVTAFDLL